MFIIVTKGGVSVPAEGTQTCRCLVSVPAHLGILPSQSPASLVVSAARRCRIELSRSCASFADMRMLGDLQDAERKHTPTALKVSLRFFCFVFQGVPFFLSVLSFSFSLSTDDFTSLIYGSTLQIRLCPFWVRSTRWILCDCPAFNRVVENEMSLSVCSLFCLISISRSTFIHAALYCAHQISKVLWNDIKKVITKNKISFLLNA